MSPRGSRFRRRGRPRAIAGRGDAEIDHRTRSMEYLYEDECTNGEGQTYSYGQFDDGYVNLRECAEDCAREVDTDDLVGVRVHLRRRGRGEVQVLGHRGGGNQGP